MAAVAEKTGTKSQDEGREDGLRGNHREKKRTTERELVDRILKSTAIDHWSVGEFVDEWTESYGKGKDLEALVNAVLSKNPDAAISPRYLNRCRSIWRKFSVPGTRRKALSWSHHLGVLEHCPDDSDKWLDEAEKKEWSVAEMLDAIIKAKGGPKPKKKPGPKSRTEPQEEAERIAEEVLEDGPEQTEEAQEEEEVVLDAIQRKIEPGAEGVKSLAEGFVGAIRKFLDGADLDAEAIKDHLAIVRSLRRACTEFENELQALLD